MSFKKFLEEDAIPAHQKAVNDKHAEGIPKIPVTVTDKKVSEPKSGVNQKKVDTDHAEGMPSYSSEIGTKKAPSSGVNQKSVDSALEQTPKKLGKSSDLGNKKVAPAFASQLQTAVDKEQEKMDKVPEDVARIQASINKQIWSMIQTSIEKINKSNNSDGVLREEKDSKAKVRNRKDPIFDNKDKKVKDSKDHFPINTENRARNALARVNQYKKSPSWFDGSLQELKDAVVKAVHKEYPEIEISDKSKK